MKEKLINKYNLISKEAKASILLTICGFLQKGISLIIVPVYTRIMPTEAYGEYSVFLSWFELVSIFVTLNTWNYFLMNGMTKYSDNVDKFISSLQGLSTVLTMAWFLIYLVFNELWERMTGLSFVVMVVMFAEFFTMPSFQYWCQRKRYEYDAKSVLIITLVLYILFPLISIPYILMAEQKGTAAIIGRAVVSSVVYLFPLISIWRKGKCWFNKEYWRNAFKFSVPLIPHFLALMILNLSDRIMIERLCGETEAAFYSVAYSAGSVLLIINSSILGSFIPYTYQSIKSNNVQNIKKKASLLLMIVGGLNILLILMAPEAISLLAPDDYMEAIYVIPPVALSNVFLFLFNLFANIEYYYEQTKQIAVVSVVCALINVVLNYICIPHYGFIAAGYTTLFCYILYSILHYCFMRRACRKFMKECQVYDTGTLVKISIMMVIIGIGVIRLYDYMMIRYMLLIAVVIVGIVKRRWIIASVKNIS